MHMTTLIAVKRLPVYRKDRSKHPMQHWLPDSTHVGLGTAVNMTILISVKESPVHCILQGALIAVLQQQPGFKQLLILWLICARQAIRLHQAQSEVAPWDSQYNL